MIKTKASVNSIVLVKVKVKYVIGEEMHILESELTPFEFDSRFPLEDQYDWFKIASNMADISWTDLTVDEFETFQETLDVNVLYDPVTAVNLN